MLKQIRRYIKFGFVLLLPAYFAMLASSVLNRHTHMLPNGIMVTHSHPFAKNTNGEKKTNHQHSGKDFVFLQSFCVGFYLTTDNTLVYNNPVYSRELSVSLPELILQEIFIPDNSNRAPPVFF